MAYSEEQIPVCYIINEPLLFLYYAQAWTTKVTYTPMHAHPLSSSEKQE